MTDLVLASKSQFRAKILRDAGLNFKQEVSDIDERAVEESLNEAALLPEDHALILAETKAVNVSEKHPHAWTIGCDQILGFKGDILHKPASMEEARQRLLLLCGETHQLFSAIVLAKAGETKWRHVSPCHLTMRDLTPEFIGRHLASVGDIALSSVGAYQIEGEGIQLFSKIEGDMFSIIGLPILPLLDILRQEKIIDG